MLTMPVEQYQQITTHYIEVLEKTNQQLSLWTNPYGIMIGALAILFTVLVGVSAFIILRQGKEYKQAFNDSMLAYQKMLDESLKQVVSESTKSIESVIQKYEKDLDGLTGDAKQKVEDIISELKTEKENIGLKTHWTFQTPQIGQANYSPKSENFWPADPTGKHSYNLLGFCPKCSNYNSTFGAVYCSRCGNKLS